MPSRSSPKVRTSKAARLKVAKPTTPITHTDRVRTRLAEEIMSGSQFPGDRLDEATLANRFKVSRTPVREALRQLTASGLVEWRAHHGAVVATITIPKMVEMFEVMAELEGLSGRLAARRMSADERRSLVLHHRRCEPPARGGDKEAYHLLNRPFHESIYSGAHNSYLREHATTLYDRLAPYRAYQLNRPGQLLRSFEEHAAIVKAIVDSDGDAAYRLLRDHVMLDGDLFSDLISSLNR